MKKVYFDLDGTLCTQRNGDYENAEPLPDKIEFCNSLYNDNEITIYTARGTMTGIDWREVTEKQLEEWGVKYHTLSVGEKPAWDVYIGDRCYNINNIKGDSFEISDTSQKG